MRVERHTFTGELDRGGVAQRTRREAARDACVGATLVERQCARRSPPVRPAGRTADHADRGPACSAASTRPSADRATSSRGGGPTRRTTSPGGGGAAGAAAYSRGRPS
jgi:hypothetical protein